EPADRPRSPAESLHFVALFGLREPLVALFGPIDEPFDEQPRLLVPQAAREQLVFQHRLQQSLHRHRARSPFRVPRNPFRGRVAVVGRSRMLLPPKKWRAHSRVFTISQGDLPKTRLGLVTLTHA